MFGSILSNWVEQELSPSLPAAGRRLSSSWGRKKTRWLPAQWADWPHLCSCGRAWLPPSFQPAGLVSAAGADRERNHCSPCSRYLRGITQGYHTGAQHSALSTLTIVLDIAVDHLFQGTKCRNIWVGLLINHHDLDKIFYSALLLLSTKIS